MNFQYPEGLATSRMLTETSPPGLSLLSHCATLPSSVSEHRSVARSTIQPNSDISDLCEIYPIYTRKLLLLSNMGLKTSPDVSESDISELYCILISLSKICARPQKRQRLFQVFETSVIFLFACRRASSCSRRLLECSNRMSSGLLQRTGASRSSAAGLKPKSYRR